MKAQLIEIIVKVIVMKSVIVISKYSLDAELLILMFLVKMIMKYVVVQRINIDKIIIIIFMKK
jgi:hypothetical protein